MIADPKPPTDPVEVQVTGRLGPGTLADVHALIAAATAADGVAPLSEHVSLHLRHGGEGPDRNVLLRRSGELVGYAHLDPTDAVLGSAAELVVHPDHRRRGYGRLLVEATAAQSPRQRLRLWAHGDHPAARALAAALGFRAARRLWLLGRDLNESLPPARFPAGVRVRAFRPGADDDTWLQLNRRAFADHPEQGRWSAADLQARLAESWFDPAGFLIAEGTAHGETAAGAVPAMIAFHWVKVHGDTPGHGHGHEPIGEVYVVGVDPAHRGRGLGTAITLAGLDWMRTRGLTRAMLYVEADNAPALAVYRRLGFRHWSTDVMFSRPAIGQACGPPRPDEPSETISP